VDQADQPHQPDPGAGRPDRPQQVRDQRTRAQLTEPGLFRFVQLEFPWALGPPDGRYLLRRDGDPPDAQPAHVLVLVTLGAPERRRRFARKQREAQPEPEPTAVATGRATIIDVGEPAADATAAGRWLADANDEYVAHALHVLNRVLHAYRLVTADPYAGPVAHRQALVTRVGYGAGEQVADGLWTEARELLESGPRLRRLKVLQPQARLAAVLGGRERALACEELVLRARLDLDHGREREAAFQVMVALDAALAELPADPTAPALADRLQELRAQREPIAAAAQAALSGPLAPAQREAVEFTVGRIEAALRARAVANA
jgi:hypothetical protein